MYLMSQLMWLVQTTTTRVPEAEEDEKGGLRGQHLCLSAVLHPLLCLVTEDEAFKNTVRALQVEGRLAGNRMSAGRCRHQLWLSDRVSPLPL